MRVEVSEREEKGRKGKKGAKETHDVERWHGEDLRPTRKKLKEGVVAGD